MVLGNTITDSQCKIAGIKCIAKGICLSRSCGTVQKKLLTLYVFIHAMIIHLKTVVQKKDEKQTHPKLVQYLFCMMWSWFFSVTLFAETAVAI